MASRQLSYTVPCFLYREAIEIDSDTMLQLAGVVTTWVLLVLVATVLNAVIVISVFILSFIEGYRNTVITRSECTMIFEFCPSLYF